MKNLQFIYFKLGVFVLSALVILVIFLYMIGKNKNLFGTNYTLKSRFHEVQGLKVGNIVRYAGIDVGSVEELNFINDTTIEVSMTIERNMKKIIRKNAIVSIGTDGLVGNKIVNITPIKIAFEMAYALNNELLSNKPPINTDDILTTFESTNQELNQLVTNLKITSLQIKESKLMNKLFDDTLYINNIDFTLNELKSFSKSINHSADKINKMLKHIEAGNGTIGKLYSDTTWESHVKTTLFNAEKSSTSLELLLDSVNALTHNINTATREGNGLINQALNNNEWPKQIDSILSQTNHSTQNFNQIMKALKKSIFFKRYFKSHKENQ